MSNNPTTIPLIQGPRPIDTLHRQNGLRFIGLIRDVTIDGKPFWEYIELLQFSGEKVFNHNGDNNTDMFKHLTHWMPEPPL